MRGAPPGAALAVLLALAVAPGLSGVVAASEGVPGLDFRAAGLETARLLSGYIRIDTTNPPGNELAGARYLERFLASQGISARVYESAPGRGNVVARLAATRPEPGLGGPILLLSHIDVVPADPEAWAFAPFSGAVEDGFVYGRGALDDKGQGAVFAMALALLARHDPVRARDLVFCASAAEEAGSGGVDWLVEHHWEALGPPGVVWNEGGASVRNVQLGNVVLNGIATTEKRALWLTLVAEGEGGHGSQPTPDGATERLVRALGRVAALETPVRLTPTVAESFRLTGDALAFPMGFVLRHMDNPLLLLAARSRLETNRVTNAMVRDTIALTGLRAGLKHNMIPRRAEASLDVRLLPDTDAEAFLAELRSVIADPRVRIEGIPDPLPPVIPASPVEQDLFQALEIEMAREIPGSTTVPTQTTGGTDSAYFRARGVPSYGFIPAELPDELVSAIHGLDERMPIAEIERALRVTYRVLQRLSVPGDT
jgi:acetylornithine deacetylase/succinyl-diaminopimelate desuccinylase-like protein